MLDYLLNAAVLGLLVEALAYALGLWSYPRAWLRIPNVLLVFGLVYGGLSWGLHGQGALVLFAAGALLGLAYELANDRWLKFWRFPGDPWTGLKGKPAVLGVGVAWGFVPLIITWVTPILS